MKAAKKNEPQQRLPVQSVREQFNSLAPSSGDDITYKYYLYVKGGGDGDLKPGLEMLYSIQDLAWEKRFAMPKMVESPFGDNLMITTTQGIMKMIARELEVGIKKIILGNYPPHLSPEDPKSFLPARKKIKSSGRNPR